MKKEEWTDTKEGAGTDTKEGAGTDTKEGAITRKDSKDMVLKLKKEEMMTPCILCKHYKRCKRNRNKTCSKFNPPTR